MGRPFCENESKDEVVVFTASAAIYADKVLDWLDPGQKLIAYRLYREACTELAGGHFKDLRRLGRSLDDVVLVDNSPLALGLRPQNGMLITSWYGDDHQDQELVILMGMLAKVQIRPRKGEMPHGNATMEKMAHLRLRYATARVV
eukprot:symbB.v1.2.013262.t1/scaffold879.1/size325971/9